MERIVNNILQLLKAFDLFKDKILISAKTMTTDSRFNVESFAVIKRC